MALAAAAAASAGLVYSPASINSRAFSHKHQRSHFSSFLGQNLRIKKRNCQYDLSGSIICIKAQLDKSGSSLSHELLENGEHFLDDLSHWISRKVAEVMKPHLPENFDVLALAPTGLQKKIISVERAGALLVREFLILGFFYSLFTRVGSFCKWLSRLHYSNTHFFSGYSKPTECDYELSAYSAMEGPLKAGIVLWGASRLLYLASPLLKLKLSLCMISKSRGVGSILIVTWFLSKWKGLVIKRLITQNRENVPQIIAFDKVVSLVMYYIAATCIGEVSGFAFGSVLAIGGVSGIAVGLAAKEIVGNFLGGTFLFLTRPFIIGDRVKAESFEGWVEDIDFLHTKVIGHDSSPMVVPNQALVNEVIVNYTRAKCKSLMAEFKLRTEDIYIVDKITHDITEYLMNHPKIDLAHGNPLCYLKAMSSHGLEIELICSIKEKEPVFEVPVEFFKTKQQIW